MHFYCTETHKSVFSGVGPKLVKRRFNNLSSMCSRNSTFAIGLDEIENISNALLFEICSGMLPLHCRISVKRSLI